MHKSAHLLYVYIVKDQSSMCYHQDQSSLCCSCCILPIHNLHICFYCCMFTQCRISLQCVIIRIAFNVLSSGLAFNVWLLLQCVRGGSQCAIQLTLIHLTDQLTKGAIELENIFYFGYIFKECRHLALFCYIQHVKQLRVALE